MIKFGLLENLAHVKIKLKRSRFTFMKFAEVRNQQPPKLGGCEEQILTVSSPDPFGTGVYHL